MNDEIYGSPISGAFIIDRKLAEAIPEEILTCGGEWWLNELSDEISIANDSYMYVTHNGIIKPHGINKNAECGIRPALSVKGVNPDPRKNRRLTLSTPGRGLTFTYAGTKDGNAVYLCDSTTGSAAYDSAVTSVQKFGNEVKTYGWKFSADPRTPGCLPLLTEKDFNFDGYLPDDDRVCTDMSLADYGWMSYMLSTRFRTNGYGDIKAVWEYGGYNTSTVYVRQVEDNIERDYKLSIPSDTVMESFCSFVRAWADANDPDMDHQYAFNGGMNALDLWNRTVSVCTVEAYLETDKNLPERLGWSINNDELRILKGKLRPVEHCTQEQPAEDIER